jgi:hypothetical protein
LIGVRARQTLARYFEPERHVLPPAGRFVDLPYLRAAGIE